MKELKKTLFVRVSCFGNPGPLEYRVMDGETFTILLSGSHELGTNNVGEFLAVVDALKYCEAHHDYGIVYTDSRVAMNWISMRRCNTSIKRDIGTESLFQEIEEAVWWLRNAQHLLIFSRSDLEMKWQGLGGPRSPQETFNANLNLLTKKYYEIHFHLFGNIGECPF